MWLQAQGKKAAMKNGPVFDHYYFSIEAAVGGLGACVVPLHLVSEDLQAKRLIAPLGFVESGYVYVAKSLNPHHPFVDLFLEWLRAEASVWTSQVAPIVA
jgi:DNA-binding transcriptional LysR family regulator